MRLAQLSLPNPDFLTDTSRLARLLLGAVAVSSLLSACAVSPETQALMDEYQSTIPSCTTQLDCETKWAQAKVWVMQNSDFPIYSESDTRIRATSPLTTSSGVGVVVTREGSGNAYQFLVDVECLNAFGCPDVWQTKLDFNRALNGG